MNENPLNVPLTLSTAHKVVVALIAIAVAAGAIVGGRMLGEYRLAELDKRCDQHDVRIGQMEQIGHPDHERRVTRLEVRADSTDKDLSAMKAQLDVAVAILQRMEKRMDTLPR